MAVRPHLEVDVHGDGGSHGDGGQVEAESLSYHRHTVQPTLAEHWAAVDDSYAFTWDRNTGGLMCNR